MRISISWLKEFIDFSLSNEEISDKLTMLGLEAEEGYNTSSLEDLIIGEIKDVIKHPNADKLNLCKVYDGQNILPVVCGAPNVELGQKIVFAPVGSTLPGNFKIKKAKIRGEISQGMICSEKEVNISDEHDGIMVLNMDASPGDLFIDYLNNHLGALELDITPNRPDCFSHLGVARDLAAKLNININTPSYDKRSFSKNIAKDMIKVSFENPEDCPRFVAGIVKNVKVGPSPDWLRHKLELAGQRSINNVVDISNFVLLEMGQPSHIFDYDKIESKNSKKYLILGDMLELGKHSVKQHKLISNIINKTKINQVYVIGKYIKETFRGLRQNKKAKILKNKFGIFNLINNNLNNNDYLMIKGSNSTGLHKITTDLKQRSSNAL